MFIFQIGGGEDDTLKVLGLPQVKKEELPTKAAIVERILQEEMEEKRVRSLVISLIHMSNFSQKMELFQIRIDYVFLLRVQLFLSL